MYLTNGYSRPSNNSLQRTALRHAADAERYLGSSSKLPAPRRKARNCFTKRWIVIPHQNSRDGIQGRRKFQFSVFSSEGRAFVKILPLALRALCGDKTGRSPVVTFGRMFRQEIGDRRSEVGGRKLEVGNPNCPLPTAHSLPPTISPSLLHCPGFPREIGSG